MHSPSVNSLYSGGSLDTTNRRAPILGCDYNNINQNILEHRSINNGNVFRSGVKAVPQSASMPAIPNAGRPTTTTSPSALAPIEYEKIRKQQTPAETGVLRSHAHTPNGKISWPNERQLGWQPKGNQGDKVTNVNQNWMPTNGSGWTNGGDYSSPWSNASPLSPVSPGMAQQSPQNWQPANFRSPDRGGPLLFTPQPQMQKIVSISDV